MFAKETYMQRRALLKKNLGSGVLLFLGNDECGLNYEDNIFRYRQDSTFLYYSDFHAPAFRLLSILMKTKKSFLEMNCLSTQSYGWDHNLHYTKNVNVWA